MPSRLVIGGTALALATYYVYQQRLQQTQSVQTTSFGSKKAPGEGSGQYAGRQLDETAAQAKNKLRDLQEDAGRKVDSGLGRIEQERANASNWASERLNETSQQAQEKADAFYKNAHAHPEANRGRLDKFGNDIKQTFSDAKDVTNETLTNVKDKVVDEVKEKKGWFSSNQRDDELAKEAQHSLHGWSETAQQNADAYYDSLHSKAEDVKGSLFSWGSSGKNKSEDALNKARDEAQRLVDDAEKKFRDTKLGWFDNDEQKKKLHDQASRQLEAAKNQLNSATDKVNQWKEQAKNAVGRNERSGGFYSWLRGDNISPEKETELARKSARSLRGWGESAEIFARDEYDEANRRLHPITEGKSRVNKKQLAFETDIQPTIDSWKKWANKKYENTYQGAQDFFNDAQDSLKEAQKEAEKPQSSWFSWGSDKSKEAQERSKKNLEEAQERVEKASNNLKRWTSGTAKDINLKFWSGADEAISETKKGVDIAADQTKKGLNEAQNWVQDRKP